MSLKTLLENSDGFPFEFFGGTILVPDGSSSLMGLIQEIGSRYSDDARLIYGDTTITDATPNAIVNQLNFEAIQDLVSRIKLMGESSSMETGSSAILLRSIRTHTGVYGDAEVRSESFYVPGEDGLYIVTFTTHYSIDLSSNLATIKNPAHIKYIITYTQVASGIFPKGNHNVRGFNQTITRKQVAVGVEETANVAYDVYLDVKSVSRYGISYAIRIMKSWTTNDQTFHIMGKTLKEATSFKTGFRAGKLRFLTGETSGSFDTTSVKSFSTEISHGELPLATYDQDIYSVDGIYNQMLYRSNGMRTPTSLIINQTSMCAVSHLMGEILLF